MQKFLFWLPIGIAVTLLSGLIYLTVQQSYRLSANDPQIQMAEDADFALAHGQPMAAVIPQKKVDIDQSLSPYFIIFDPNGRPIAGNGRLNGTVPTLPAGVFKSVESHNGESRITWEPAPGVRSAVVIRWIEPGNFLLVGRSLREVEHREELLALQVGLGWIVTIVATLIVSLCLNKSPVIAKKRKK